MPETFESDILNKLFEDYHQAPRRKEPGDGPGEGQEPDEKGEDAGKSWAEMVEEEFPDGKRMEEKIQDLSELFRKLLKREDGTPEDPARVKSLMFVLELAVETLVRDFLEGVYVDFEEVKEEDVYRLRRFVREAAMEFAS